MIRDLVADLGGNVDRIEWLEQISSAFDIHPGCPGKYGNSLADGMCVIWQGGTDFESGSAGAEPTCAARFAGKFPEPDPRRDGHGLGVARPN